MKKSTKFLFILSLFCIGFGIVAILWGDKNGGLKDIKEATAPQKIQKELSSFKQLNLNLNTRDLVIEPSKDDKWHLSYYSDDKVLGELSTQQDGDKLSLKELEKGNIVTEPLSALGYYLNNKDKDSHDVVLSVPKNAKFDSIKGYVSGSAHLYNFSVKEVNLTSESIYTDDTSISKADLSASSLYLDNSNISQLTLKDSDYLSFTNSTIKDSELEGDATILDIDKSQLQNTLVAIENGSFTFTDTELDNVSLTGDSNAITAKQLILKNLVEITSHYSYITIQLDDKTRTSTNFNIKVTNDDLKASDMIAGPDKVTSDDNQENLTFNKQVKDNKATLTIDNQEGPVSID